MVAMGVGDALGAGFEYVDPGIVKKYNTLEMYHSHPRWNIPPGHYTDDTQMAIALAEFMLSGQPVTTLNLADAFVRQFKADPRAGYAGGFYELLQECADGFDLLKRIQPHSTKSGGAMRAGVCGLLPSIAATIDRAMWQASVTHATHFGMAAAAASALLVWQCRQGISREDLHDIIERNCSLPGISWRHSWDKPVGASGTEAVRAALTAIKEHNTLSGVLKACIAFTGDVDTVAAIAMPAAALHPGIEQDLPQHLIDNLENGEFGLDYLRELDHRLLTTFAPTES